MIFRPDGSFVAQPKLHITPSDFEFARDGIQAEADPNVETMLVTDLDIRDLYRPREAGSVTPLLDRRRDLFELKGHLDDSNRV